MHDVFPATLAYIFEYTSPAGVKQLQQAQALLVTLGASCSASEFLTLYGDSASAALLTSTYSSANMQNLRHSAGTQSIA